MAFPYARLRRGLKRWMQRAGWGAGLAFALLLSVYYWVSASSQGHIFTDISSLPYRPVALVPGTSHLTRQGAPNPFFHSRMDAAASLYQSGKVKHLILSGDNRTEYYNEPQRMREELIRRGIPEEALTLDYAGLRTFDSVIRCKEIFGQEQVVIVSQRFHNERALFIARRRGMDAIAFNAEDASLRNNLRPYLREFLARVQTVLDLFVLDTQPRHLGEKVEIEFLEEEWPVRE
jgi:SanA protein